MSDEWGLLDALFDLVDDIRDAWVEARDRRREHRANETDQETEGK